MKKRIIGLTVLVATLGGCSKEPTMYEKCLAAETTKLEAVDIKLLNKISGFNEAAHQILVDTIARFQTLDMKKYQAYLDKRRAYFEEHVEKPRLSNNLYLAFEASRNDLNAKHPNWFDLEYDEYSKLKEYDTYKLMRSLCEDSPACERLFTGNAMKEIWKEDPTRELFDRDAFNKIMRDVSWTPYLGYEAKSKFDLDWFANEMQTNSPKHLVKVNDALRHNAEGLVAQDIMYFQYWAEKFEALRPNLTTMANETCNKRGLYK